MDIAGVISTIVLIIFFFSVVTRQTLPELLLPIQKRNYKALKEPVGDPLRKSAPRPARRKTHRRPSEIPLNQDEGLRAAFYTNDSGELLVAQSAHPPDRSALSRLAARDFANWRSHRLDIPVSGEPLQTLSTIRGSFMVSIQRTRCGASSLAAKEDTEVFPMLNDYNPAGFAVARGNDRQRC